MDDLFSSEPLVITVGDLTRRVRELLENGVGTIWVSGEISNHRKQSSGHQYFTLKDDRAQLACVLFARSGAKQKLEDGMAVQLFGNITVYEARGQYQMVVQKVQLQGQGALQAKFEALKRQLDAEGLFDPARKKALPKFPQVIGLVTSPTGAALQDMLNVLSRRAPWLRILLIPVRVQGGEAAEEIAGAIRQFNTEYLEEVDVLIVGRGGGSLEDLWPFNEEVVARAMAASEIPVVSAVGHEIDFTIADFTADLRAPTPSAAAELVAPDGGELRERLSLLQGRVRRQLQGAIFQETEKLNRILAPALQRETLRLLGNHAQGADQLAGDLKRLTDERLGAFQQRLQQAREAVERHRPDQLLALRRQASERLQERFLAIFSRGMLDRQQRLDRLAGMLRVLGPDSILQRGYSILTRADGSLITSTKKVTTGETVRNRLSDGEITSTVS